MPASGIQFANDELSTLKDLARAMQGMNQGENGMRTRYKAVGAAGATATYGHGAGGLFSGLGREKPIFSAMALPYQGLQGILPVKKSNSTNPIFDLLTGVTATTGVEPADVCGDFPRAGLAKLCSRSFVFGQMGRSMQAYDLTRVGEVRNRGEFLDQTLYGDPFKGSGGQSSMVPTLGNGGGEFNNGVTNTELGKALFEFAVTWSRDFAKDIYTATPYSNNPATKGRKYFFGLDALINTNLQDVDTGVLCPAADSTLISYGGKRVDSADSGYFVRLLTATYVRLQYLAIQTGLAPVEWVLSMPWSLFYEVTEVWPCAYQSYRCQVLGDNNEAFVDGMELTKMRDDMRGDIDNRTGQYLLVNGQRVPVILDDAAAESTVGGGLRESTIYFVPLTVLGNTPTTYMEYYDFSAKGAGEDYARALGFNNFKTSDDGRFFWVAPPSKGFCVDLQIFTKTRLMLLVPHLAARLTNIRYAPILANRSGFPGDPYYVNGGRTTGFDLGYLYPPVQ